MQPIHTHIHIILEYLSLIYFPILPILPKILVGTDIRLKYSNIKYRYLSTPILPLHTLYLTFRPTYGRAIYLRGNQEIIRL